MTYDMYRGRFTNVMKEMGFKGLTPHCTRHTFSTQVKPDIEVIQQGNMRITSVEQTVVDSIRDFEKIAGLEEVIRCMMLVPGLNEQKVLTCLAQNDNGFLYQKCGYIFEELKEEFHFRLNFLQSVRHILLMQENI